MCLACVFDLVSFSVPQTPQGWYQNTWLKGMMFKRDIQRIKWTPRLITLTWTSKNPGEKTHLPCTCLPSSQVRVKAAWLQGVVWTAQELCHLEVPGVRPLFWLIIPVSWRGSTFLGVQVNPFFCCWQFREDWSGVSQSRVGPNLWASEIEM